MPPKSLSSFVSFPMGIYLGATDADKLRIIISRVNCVSRLSFCIACSRVRQIYRLGCDFHIQVHDLRMLDIASRSKSSCGYLLDICQISNASDKYPH
ncbi:hypothetical protein BDW66DRAFT_30665 [Aspergillus desertorum]